MSASIGTMIKKIGGLVDTHDLDDWETGFVKGVVQRTNNGADTTRLSEKQVEIVERIHSKHFA